MANSFLAMTLFHAFFVQGNARTHPGYAPNLIFIIFLETLFLFLVYAIASIVALCIINVFHGVVSYIYYNQIYLASYLTPTATNALHLSLYPEYSLCRLDRYGFYILSIVFCLYQILIILWTFWTPYKRRRAMEHKDEKIRADFMSKIGSGELSSGK